MHNEHAMVLADILEQLKAATVEFDDPIDRGVWNLSIQRATRLMERDVPTLHPVDQVIRMAREQGA